MAKPRVLVADDNDAICTLLRALLQRDYDVEMVNDGAQAIARLRTRSYSAIVLDLLMPEVDGFSVLEFLRNERPAQLGRVVVLTAAVTEREITRVRAFAVHDIIRKPFEVEVLLEAVRECAGEPDGSHGSTALFAGGMLLFIAEMLSGR
jgi:CheY-like chemotaxis protein